MKTIHEYILITAKEELSRAGKLLDYGCGRGELVATARDNGIEAYGCDLFYEGGNYQLELVEGLDTSVFRMIGGLIPFPDAHFECVIANQVFEHIDDWSQPLTEIDRVLKPGGVLLALFPIREAWREGHIGVPFVHWFRRDSKLRRPYTLFLRYLGFGLHKNLVRPIPQWVDTYLAWIDDWTYYKRHNEAVDRFRQRFAVESRETEYLLFRLCRTRLKFLFPAFSRLPPVTQFLCRRLSGAVLAMRKPGDRLAAALPLATSIAL